MEIYVNNQMLEVAARTTVADLALRLDLPSAGVAIAVGGVVVQRAQWSSRELVNGEKVLIIKAAYGG